MLLEGTTNVGGQLLMGPGEVISLVVANTIKVVPFQISVASLPILVRGISILLLGSPKPSLLGLPGWITTTRATTSSFA